MKRATKIQTLAWSLASFVLVSCGGGGGGDSTPTPTPAATIAVVKVATSGTLPPGATIGGILSRVVAAQPANLTIAAADIKPTGAGASSLLMPNTGTDVVLGLINATGIQTGEFATLHFHVAAGTSPRAEDFTIAPGASVIDAANGAPIAGINVVVQSVTLQ